LAAFFQMICEYRKEMGLDEKDIRRKSIKIPKNISKKKKDFQYILINNKMLLFINTPI